MKNQTKHARHRVGLILALSGLMGGITLPLASTSVAAAKQSDSGSIPFVSSQANPETLNRWSTNGPEGADILALAIDPSHPATIYAGTGGGLFKSTNGGESWSSSLPLNMVQALAIDPRTPTTLYAAISGYDSLDRPQAGISKSV